MLGLISKKKALKNIEKLLRESFEEGNDITDPILEHSFTEEDEFKMKYLIRSSHFWSISHLMQYIKLTMEE